MRRAPGLLILAIIIYSDPWGICAGKRGVSCQGGSTLTGGQWGFVSLSHCQRQSITVLEAALQGDLFSRLVSPISGTLSTPGSPDCSGSWMQGREPA